MTNDTEYLFVYLTINFWINRPRKKNGTLIRLPHVQHTGWTPFPKTFCDRSGLERLEGNQPLKREKNLARVLVR